MTKETSRREFMRLSAGFSILGAGAPLALQLAAAGSAAADDDHYKALICIFLAGGQDSNNMVLATDTDSWTRYRSARHISAEQTIALMPPGTVRAGGDIYNPRAWGGVLPIVPRTPLYIPGTEQVREFALHPMLGQIVPMFEEQRLAVLANVGMLRTPLDRDKYERRTAEVPQQLFSHNDQQSSWQALAVEGAQSGWGGRIADAIHGRNQRDKVVFTAISASGNAVFLSGNDVNQYCVSTDGDPGVTIGGIPSGSVFGSSRGGAALNNIIRSAPGNSVFAREYAEVVKRSIGAAKDINDMSKKADANTIGNPPAFAAPFPNRPPNILATQLRTVMKIIAGAPSMGIKRQVFFVQIGGFDTHSNQNQTEPDNLARLAHALKYLDTELADVNGQDLRSRVTAFTASDFSRTFATNGSGTDHAWGGHHFIWGGAVDGGNIFGQYPTLGVDAPGFRNPDISDGHMIPTSSVDQYGATLAKWFGVSESDMDGVFPKIGEFDTPDLGFMRFKTPEVPASRG